MLSRRAFSALAFGLAGTARQVAARPLDAGEPLPAPIASLRSRAAEAHPISLTERSDRLDRARALMKRNGIGAIAMIGGTSLVYFTGIRWWNRERLFTFVLPQKGKPFYVSPAFEEDRVREQISHAPEGDESRILTWQEDEDPCRSVARGLSELGLATDRIGIEEPVTFVFSNGIAKASPGVEIVSATPVTAGCRMVKSTAELAYVAGCPCHSCGLQSRLAELTARHDAASIHAACRLGTPAAWL